MEHARDNRDFYGRRYGQRGLVLSQLAFERMSLLRKCHSEPAAAAKNLGKGYPLPHQIPRFAQNDTSQFELTEY